MPKLPNNHTSAYIAIHNQAILLIGASNSENHDGLGKKCYQLNKGIWKEHSTLNHWRHYASVVTTNSATFIFGGQGGRKTYEYLPKQSDTWLPGQTEIPDGFQNGSALAVRSEQEIWLIGGYNTESRILSFNVKDHTFEELTVKLNVGRVGGDIDLHLFQEQIKSSSLEVKTIKEKLLTQVLVMFNLLLKYWTLKMKQLQWEVLC